ncbi:hypothetical protein [Desulfosporosinus hippei]|uniref:Uncharacterized protein n=1 Tax=Desulfosporosinus hippei DSM 8344 TaxID=1121419 RepID=A0A1G7V5V2_9FIRM|nr:hypothetical protein [Desulfosporosinus hippei]SDG54739.1 hypothetical protein SAMN05443529_1046 [Desulfosporosinus hippei DSM 8344]
MDKEDVNKINKGGEDMQAVPKEKDYKGLSLSPEKLEKITIKPIVKDGKLLFDKNNKDHRYIVEEGEY